MEAFTLITGATSGIGEALSIFLSKERNLILLGRNENKLSVTKERCSKDHFVLTMKCDLDTEITEIFKRLTDYLIDKDIVVDAFVHCAGITKILPFRSYSFTDLQSVFNTNVFSAMEILKVLMKRVNHKELKNIVFISSLWSIRGERANSLYASSKGALNSLVFSLAKELAPNTRINAILPGAVQTPMSKDVLESEAGKLQLNDYPLGFGVPQDVVNLISFLLSDKSKWLNGQLISLDGGRSIL